tara:strand:- start:4286 stop:5137 length:852 start_codon:yes stop_codon:yes gene_type:complete
MTNHSNHSVKHIRCSVGILTYNSEKKIRRALESVEGFTDIVLCDGGSTDRTLEIAREYGCRVVDQYAKNNPGHNPNHPICDFARERNIVLEAANEDWFLYIDSDEYISDELREEIRSITSSNSEDCMAFEIPIGNQSPDGAVTYKPWKQNYQVRFFNRKIGGHFKKVMHERYDFDREKHPTRKLTGKWYVPFSKPDFQGYSKAVNYRLEILLSQAPPTTLGQFLYSGVLIPIKRLLGFTYRMVLMRMFYPWKQIVPLYYFRNQCYSQWVIFRISLKLYLSHKV